MFKTFSQIIYKILYFIDIIVLKIFRRSFLIWFKDFIDRDFYKTIKIPDKKIEIKFFTPNYLTNWLTNEFKTKEPETISWIENFKEGDNRKIIFWDIGANLGLYSIYASKIYDNIEVVSFEPSTSNLRVLSRNISINDLHNKIKIFQLPLGEKPFSFSLMRENKFGEGQSINVFDVPLNFEGKKFISSNNYQVLGTSINSILDNKFLQIPNYIKIDIDGLEHLILKGASKYLSHKDIKSIQIEINENFKEQHEMVKKILLENNFKFQFKKRNESLEIYKNKKFLNTYKYYFEKSL